MGTMEQLNYKTGADLMYDVRNLGKFGHIHRDGDFVWHECKTCRGPLLGHVMKEDECEAEPLEPDVILDLKKRAMENDLFEVMKACMDTRSEHRKCATCNVSFDNRMGLESHVKK